MSGIIDCSNYQAVNASNKQNDIADREKDAPQDLSHEDTENPFGDESRAEVKYRTLAWWSVTA